MRRLTTVFEILVFRIKSISSARIVIIVNEKLNRLPIFNKLKSEIDN